MQIWNRVQEYFERASDTNIIRLERVRLLSFIVVYLRIKILSPDYCLLAIG